ncbi:N-acetylmuramoyl-L-alanine amidase [Agathobaculum desmolans]|uniref:N-acetylmuramoyl-L-alanine amidase family protein n=1 Tax=Agathobaculum desmolans TaxID=39484 RepID=UPI0029421A85|nr:N-acetylmuramoyl-L-alanine amidase [Agathobaculum desmolans]
MICLAIRIFIDQGHNPSGPNTGAEGNGLREQDITYAVGLYLAGLLRDDPRFEVRQSRNTPDEVLGTSNSTSLAARVRAANNWPADYFISIHCNSNPNPAINGSEVYVYRTNSQPYWLAQHVLNGIVARTGTKDNGVRLNPALYVLRRTQMPAILVELAYLSNQEDARRLESDPFGFAQGIYNGLLSYFGFAPL